MTEPSRPRRNVLIVVDDLNTHWLSVLTEIGPGVDYRILPLGIGSEAYAQAHSPLLKRCRVEIISVDAIAQQARASIQEKYPQLIFDLARRPLRGGKSLLDLLAIEDGANMWWLSETSEKSVFRSPLVNDLYFLRFVSLASERLRPDEIWISVSSRALRATLCSFKPLNGRKVAVRPCARPMKARLRIEAPFIAALLVRRLYLLTRITLQYLLLPFVCRRGGTGGTKIFLFALYPTMWINPFSDRPTDRTYGILSSVLNTWKKTGYLITFNLSPFRLWRHRKRIRENFGRLNAVPLLGCATVTDLLSLIRPAYLLKIVRAMWILNRTALKGEGEFDISPIVRREIGHSLSRSELPLDILWLRCLRRLGRRHRVEFIVHWGEFQPIEKAIWYGARTAGIRTVAFQHSACSPMFLSYHFADGELTGYVHDPQAKDAMPLPTLIATTGAYALDILRKSGFPAERIRVCGAIRYRRVLELRSTIGLGRGSRETLGVLGSRRVIVMATTTKRRDNLTMVNALGAALSGTAEGVTVILKIHPLLPRRDEEDLASVLRERNPKVECLTFKQEVPLHELLSACDILVTNSSATGLEAMALGVMPVFYHNPYLYDLSVLYSLEDSIILASSSGELASALDLVFSEADSLSERQSRWDNDLANLFHRIDTEAESRLLEFLRRYSDDGNGDHARDSRDTEPAGAGAMR